MSLIIPTAISVLYFASVLFIFVFSMVQLTLVLSFRRNLKKKRVPRSMPDGARWPKVTVQLPIYNELYVAERLIDSIASLDYPGDRLEIQVLDDSNDETVEIVARKVAEWNSRGIDIKHIQRPNRTGFKAGALAWGMKSASGDFIAIFDADFLPPTDFLKRTVPEFQNKNIGMVQTRWGHINEDYSLLTALQAFGLNGHFIIEQIGRNNAHSFINFNGTAGVWRRKCIDTSGGWSADTLTEDLDLSYRAQMKGWKFKYLSDVVTPAELPIIMPAIKSQQYRWNKGGAETARKHLGNILTDGNLCWRTKIHAFFHLASSSVFLGLFISTLLSLPVLLIKKTIPAFEIIFHLGIVFTFGFLCIAWFYWLSAKATNGKNSSLYFWKRFPLFISLCMGLSLHNSIAVVEGWLGRKSPFIRTPKFNVTNAGDSWSNNVYIRKSLSPGVLLEMLLCLYFAVGFILSVLLGEFGFALFMIMPTLGFFLVSFTSLTANRHVNA